MDTDSKFVVVGSILLFNWLIFDALYGIRIVLNLINLGLLLYLGWSIFKKRIALDIYLKMNIGSIYIYAFFAYIVNLIFNLWMGMYPWLYAPINVIIVAYSSWFTYRNWSLVRLYLELIWLRFRAIFGLR
jgi:hypothetical protein